MFLQNSHSGTTCLSSPPLRSPTLSRHLNSRFPVSNFISSSNPASPRRRSRHFPAVSEVSHFGGRLHATSMEKPEVGVESAGSGKVEWFNKRKELWVEPRDKESLLELIENNETGKPIVLDCYAGWCSSCKAAYPALCKVAANEDYTKNFLFAKADIQVPGIIGFIRSHGVKGIPTIMVFDPSGEVLATFGASFRKINMVKANLVVMAANAGSQFRVDPNGFVIPKPEE